MSKVIYIFILLFLIFNPLYSYIDPGTGSLLVSSLFGIFMIVIYSVRGIFYTLWAKITGKKATITNDMSGKLVFFNEGKNYWDVFFPVLNELIKRDIPLTYLTADTNDPGLELLNIDDKYCFDQFRNAIPFLNNLKADTLVMTTPQLGVVQLKRSKHVRHYCHLLHAPVDIHTYKRFAFDYFDSVLCSSSYQIENLRYLENKRSHKAKLLLQTGCTYYDVRKSLKDEGDSILLAPTWGEKTFFWDWGDELITNILKNGNKVILRPHPQSWISDKGKLELIISKFDSHEKFSVDKSVDNRESLTKAEMMICDISGVIYDFIFLQNKPVICVKRDSKNGGFEEYDIKNSNSAIDLLNDVGLYIHPPELMDFEKAYLQVKEKNIGKETINKHIYNFGKAGSVAADQIQAIYEGTLNT